MLVADPSAPRVPILTEDEALVADIARTVIVRILDRVDHPPTVSRP